MTVRAHFSKRKHWWPSLIPLSLTSFMKTFFKGFWDLYSFIFEWRYSLQCYSTFVGEHLILRFKVQGLDIIPNAWKCVVFWTSLHRISCTGVLLTLQGISSTIVFYTETSCNKSWKKTKPIWQCVVSLLVNGAKILRILFAKMLKLYWNVSSNE